MKYIISEIQLDKLFEGKQFPIDARLIVKLFKYLDEEKKKKKTRASLLEAIERMSMFMTIPSKYSLFLLELYMLNFRKDGDYSGLTKDNYVDPRDLKGKTTPNTKSYLYTAAQLPFRGSNLVGSWDKDYKGTPYYKVVSYGWYPIFIFKDGKWYEVTKRYSSSTGRQMSNADPIDYNEDIDSEVYLLTPDEMKMLDRGISHEEIMRKKFEKLKSLESEYQKKRMKTAKTWRWYGQETPNANIKYKIKAIDIEGDKAIVTVDVHDVLKREEGKGVKTPENYLKGEFPNLKPEEVENKIRMNLYPELKDYMGKRMKISDREPNWIYDKIDFKFNHLRK